MASQHDVELGGDIQGQTAVAREDHFGDLLADVGMSDVFYHPHRDARESIINLGNLHRMTIHALQKDIVEEVAKIGDTHTVDKDQICRIRATLGSYGECLPKLITILVR